MCGAALGKGKSLVVTVGRGVCSLWPYVTSRCLATCKASSWCISVYIHVGIIPEVRLHYVGILTNMSYIPFQNGLRLLTVSAAQLSSNCACARGTDCCSNSLYLASLWESIVSVGWLGMRSLGQQTPNSSYTATQLYIQMRYPLFTNYWLHTGCSILPGSIPSRF